ncbi:MAG: rRNA maturation RNase YbeY [Candidatus Paceibacterota bacterium]|jgi:probable rRNA maturation factor
MFSTVNHLKRRIPQLPLAEIADKILGPKYELGLVFVADKEMHALNREHRHHDYPTNILSFPLDKNEGEILINLDKAEREAPEFDHDFKNHLIFLFIHGCLHLKGMTHGSIMIKAEKKFFDLYGTPNHHGSGHRHCVASRRGVRVQKGR